MSNIKLTNGVLLDQSSVDGLAGLDKNNVLVSGTKNWTATEDCYVIVNSTSWSCDLSIDDITVVYVYATNSDGKRGWGIAKKGQRIACGESTAIAYGLKK